MKLKDAIVMCVNERNAAMAGRIVDMLRFKAGMNHRQVYEFANNLAPISLADWDEMLYYCDKKEGGK